MNPLFAISLLLLTDCSSLPIKVPCEAGKQRKVHGEAQNVLIILQNGKFLDK